ncbi:hypothetical protein PR048_014164 [Dryococelus australis]|uniref:Nuclease HARBI1 n=1 Tax=Dryococelus australis TaxID=614101 RepID=A0ABQ9HDE7_9NEOP|nr:hypothetical protein PR048_014164 [Dryococelus australis]
MGDIFGVHKSTTSRIIKKISEAVASLRPQFIHLPHTNEELAEVQHGFHQISAFPRVFGTLDCTHVRIKSPVGYAVGRKILPSLRNPATSEDHLYNESLTRARNKVKREYGVLKARFPAIALGIHLQLDNVQAIMEDVPPVDPEFQNEVNMVIVEGEIPVINDEIGPEAVRQTFVDYFSRVR